MEQDKLIEKIKAKLYHHRVAAPSQLWQRIAADLPKQSSQTPIAFRRWYLSVAAVVAVLLIVASVVLHFIPSATTHSEVLVAATDTVETHILPLVQEEENDDIELIEKTAQKLPVEKLQNIFALASEIAEGYGCSAETENIAVNPIDSTRILCAQCIEEATDTIPLMQPDVAVIDMEQQDSVIESLEDELLLLDYDVVDYIAQCSHINQKPDVWLSIEANTSFSQTTVAPFTMRSGNDELIFEHSMPLNAELLVEKKFGDWGVGLGFSYTYLFSEYQMGDNLRKGSQELHYVGIPLHVSYEFAQLSRFSFYVSLGGEIDFNTKGLQKENPESAYYNSCAKSVFYDEKPHLSVQGAVGAAFSILPNLALYVEPTLAYYFNNGTTIHSLWQDSPLNLSISLGLRTGF